MYSGWGSGPRRGYPSWYSLKNICSAICESENQGNVIINLQNLFLFSKEI
jgi:hypothetical protein